MNQFDDDELRDELQGLAPAVDVRGALDALRPRPRRARTRHRARLAAGVATISVVFAGGAFALTNVGDDRVQVTPATSPDIAAETSTSTSVPDTTTSTTQPGVLVPPPTVPPTDVTTPTSTGPAPTAAPTPTTDDHGGNRGRDDTAIPDTETRTYTGEGGSIDLQVVDGRLVLVAVHEAPGYRESSRDVRDTRVRVDFERETGDRRGPPLRVEVRLQDGEVRQT